MQLPTTSSRTAAAPSVPFQLGWADPVSRTSIEFRLRAIRELLISDPALFSEARLLFGYSEAGGPTRTWHVLDHEAIDLDSAGHLTEDARHHVCALLSTEDQLARITGLYLRSNPAAAPQILREIAACHPLFSRTMLVLAGTPAEVAAGIWEPGSSFVSWTGLRFPASFEILQSRDYGPFQPVYTSARPDPFAAVPPPPPPDVPPPVLPQRLQERNDSAWLPAPAPPPGNPNWTGAQSPASADRKMAFEFRVSNGAWAGIVVLLLSLIGGASWYLTRVSPSPGSTPVPADSQPPAAQLGLKASRRSGQDIEISWSNRSAALLSATAGRLLIADGPQQRDIALTPDYLRSGQILYVAESGDVEVTLTVFTPAGDVRESLRIIRSHDNRSVSTTPVQTRRIPPPPASLHSPAEPPVSTPPPAQNTAASQVPLQTDMSSVATPSAMLPLPELKLRAALQKAPPPATPPAQPAAQPVTSPAVTEELSTAQPALAPVPQPESPTTVRSPAPEPVTVTTMAPAPSPAPARTSRAQPVQPAPSPAIQPPVPISQVQPVVPSQIRSLMNRDFVISVVLNIDAQGRVVSVDSQPATGAQAFLTRSAVEAARKWRFRPALRNGVPVSAAHTLHFRFSNRPANPSRR